VNLYWARFQTRYAVPVLMVVDGPEITLVLSSSPEILKDVFRSAPFQFGNVRNADFEQSIFASKRRHEVDASQYPLHDKM
jgi:hypothetical protein